MNKIIGFIGCGNMAQAMIGGMVNSGLLDGENIIGSNPTCGKLDVLKQKYNIKITQSNKEVAESADIIFLSVKPNKYESVIKEIRDYVKSEVMIISIAAGISLKFVEECFQKKVKVVGAMPNTPALVGEAMSAVCCNDIVNEEELQLAVKLFESFGKVEVIDEKLMNVIPSISGSSPAYVYMFIEALADGGVLRGIPRDKAYKLAAQAVLGAAKMVLETGEHPGMLKDKVCSPGGTTIEAVYTLEKNNFRGAVISAMESCTEKTIKMSNKK